eukprot:XP_017951809.1 PREDICTED: KATNB1-like protein 1 isoform X2 [Xenopus tropicalis]
MASGAHLTKKRDLDESSSNDFPRKRISPSAKQNMKEGNNKSQEELVSDRNRTQIEQSLHSNENHFKVVYCKRKAHYQTLSPTYKKKQLPKAWGCDMANKENELAAGNLHDKLQNDRRSFALNSSDSSSSHTEGPSNKYSSFFAEVSKDHETMEQVLFSRNLRLNVALTFWRKRSINELVAYLVRYVIVGLNWLQAVVKRWWTQLSVNSENASDENILVLKRQISGMWQQENHLTSVPGYTGNIAKDLDGYLSQLR